MRRRKVAISFAGCGFVGPYQSGAVKCLLERAPELLGQEFYGTSAGALLAVWIVCKLELALLDEWVEQVFCDSRRYRLGLLNPTFDLYARLEKLLEDNLPRRAHHMVKGRVQISMTVFPQWKNWAVSDFTTRKELINAIVASSFVPGYTQLHSLPVFRGKWCIDGGLSCNQPGADGPHAITISPFSGEVDICPRGESASPHVPRVLGMSFQICMMNIMRGLRCVLPNSLEEMKHAHYRGYQDALRFLQIEGFLCPLYPMLHLKRNLCVTEPVGPEAGRSDSRTQQE